MIYVSLPALADEAGTTLKVLCEKARDLGVQAWFRVEGVPMLRPRDLRKCVGQALADKDKEVGAAHERASPAEWPRDGVLRGEAARRVIAAAAKARQIPPNYKWKEGAARYSGWAALPLRGEDLREPAVDLAAGESWKAWEGCMRPDEGPRDPFTIFEAGESWIERVGCVRPDEGEAIEVDLVVVDNTSDGRGEVPITIKQLHVDAHGREALLRELRRSELLDGPPPGMKPPDGVLWEDVAALSEPGAPPELVVALQAWAKLRAYLVKGGKVLPAKKPDRPHGSAPHWLGDLVKEADPGAKPDKLKRLATVINTRKGGGAVPNT